MRINIRKLWENALPNKKRHRGWKFEGVMQGQEGLIWPDRCVFFWCDGFISLSWFVAADMGVGQKRYTVENFQKVFKIDKTVGW